MCHEHHVRAWNHERPDRFADNGDESSEADDDMPPFFSDEEPEDAELLTDGGEGS